MSSLPPAKDEPDTCYFKEGADGNRNQDFPPASCGLRAVNTNISATQHHSVEPLHPDDRLHLLRLASIISERAPLFHSQRDGASQEQAAVQDNGENENVLDPNSPNFDVYAWAKRMMQLGQEKGIKRRYGGVVFKNVNVYGPDMALRPQSTVGSLFAVFANSVLSIFRQRMKKTIIRQFEGVLKSGEMLIVLGKPGSGCSTFMKTISGDLHGLYLDQNSIINYNGIPRDKMVKEYKGELAYNQEVDRHFPYLTVGQTLEFASYVRTPSQRVRDLSRKENAKYITQVAMAVFGLAHTYNTKVGNDYVRGVSGGERKRVSIAEMTVAGSSLACWDNSSRGLDAATALEFIKALRISSGLLGPCHLVAIYQASQAIFDIFDKAIVLYEGREIYYGPTSAAKTYFEDMGWHCPARQTTGDFLTAVTDPQARRARPGFEDRVPRTPDEFHAYWQASQEYASLQREIMEYEAKCPLGGKATRDFREARRAQQTKYIRPVRFMPLALHIAS